ncbi:MAG: hypothetical protein C0478_13365 [Planctomyces sp.]|nr:hypothetical protein [Planctomyces sp.]
MTLPAPPAHLGFSLRPAARLPQMAILIAATALSGCGEPRTPARRPEVVSFTENPYRYPKSVKVPEGIPLVSLAGNSDKSGEVTGKVVRLGVSDWYRGHHIGWSLFLEEKRIEEERRLGILKQNPDLWGSLHSGEQSNGVKSEFRDLGAEHGYAAIKQRWNTQKSRFSPKQNIRLLREAFDEIATSSYFYETEMTDDEIDADEGMLFSTP